MERNENTIKSQAERSAPDELSKAESLKKMVTHAIGLHIDVDGAWRLYTHGLATHEDYLTMCNDACKKFIENTVDVYEPETV